MCDLSNRPGACSGDPYLHERPPVLKGELLARLLIGIAAQETTGASDCGSYFAIYEKADLAGDFDDGGDSPRG